MRTRAAYLPFRVPCAIARHRLIIDIRRAACYCRCRCCRSCRCYLLTHSRINCLFSGAYICSSVLLGRRSQYSATLSSCDVHAQRHQFGVGRAPPCLCASSHPSHIVYNAYTPNPNPPYDRPAIRPTWNRWLSEDNNDGMPAHCAQRRQRRRRTQQTANSKRMAKRRAPFIMTIMIMNTMIVISMRTLVDCAYEAHVRMNGSAECLSV